MKKSFIDKMAAAYLKMYNVKESLLTVCYSNDVRGGGGGCGKKK